MAKLELKATLTNGKVDTDMTVTGDVMDCIAMLAAMQNHVFLTYKKMGIDAGMSMEELTNSVAATAKASLSADINRFNGGNQGLSGPMN